MRVNFLKVLEEFVQIAEADIAAAEVIPKVRLHLGQI